MSLPFAYVFEKRSQQYRGEAEHQPPRHKKSQ
jgi:hypothetical protein